MLVMSLYLVQPFQVYKNWIIYAQIIHPYALLNFGIKRQNVWWYVKARVVSSQWYLKNKPIQNVEDMDITFNNNYKYNDYVSTRIQKAKWSMFSISNIGMSYPSLNTKSISSLIQNHVCLLYYMVLIVYPWVSIMLLRLSLHKVTSWNTFEVSAKDLIIVIFFKLLA